MIADSALSPRVRRVLGLIYRLEAYEQSQLRRALVEQTASVSVEDKVEDEAVATAAAYFREKADRYAVQPSLDDPFIGDLSFRAYFALPDEEAGALWESLAEDAPTLEELPCASLDSHARMLWC